MQFAIQTTRTKKLCLNQVWEPPKHDFGPFGAPFGGFSDALGLFLGPFWMPLGASLTFLGPFECFLMRLRTIWEGFGSYMSSIWLAFAHVLLHILLQEPPRCLATRRGASQYAGVPNPMSVLNVQTSGFGRSFCSYKLFGHGLLLLQLNSNSR